MRRGKTEWRTAMALRRRIMHALRTTVCFFRPQEQPSQAGPGQAKPRKARPSQAKPSQAKPSQAKPSQAKPSQANPRWRPANRLRPRQNKERPQQGSPERRKKHNQNDTRSDKAQHRQLSTGVTTTDPRWDYLTASIVIVSTTTDALQH